MTAERDDEKFAQLVDAIGPYLDRVVIVGGWAHRLFRNHPLAQPVPYPPLMTRDTDIAVAPSIRPDEQSLRERLLSHGFHEEFLGDDRPPVTHYYLGSGDTGFYVEFLTPLVGGEFTNWHVQPVPLGVAEAGVKKHNYKQADAGAGHPGGYAAPPPQDDGGDGLRECAKLQRTRHTGMDGHRASVSRHEEPCG